MQLHHEAYVLDVHTDVSTKFPSRRTWHACNLQAREKNIENTRISPCHAIASNRTLPNPLSRLLPSNEAFLDCIFLHLPHLCPALGGSGVAREALELGGWRAP